MPDLGLVGFGAFGRLMARHLHKHFAIYAYDPGHPEPARGVTFADIATVARCPIVVLAMPVDRIADAIEAIRPHLRPGTLVMDVGSVKVRPTETMLWRRATSAPCTTEARE